MHIQKGYSYMRTFNDEMANICTKIDEQSSIDVRLYIYWSSGYIFVPLFARAIGSFFSAVHQTQKASA